MKPNKSIALALASVSVVPVAGAPVPKDRPNILWLSFEDTSPYEFACYGNPDNRTPVIDSLARIGLQFMNAYSNGPQSSPARSTLITGCYATTYGMDWHRRRVPTPADIFFPQYLRDAGYFCTNNQKTDYNSTINNAVCWDECHNGATYNSPARRADQPFFAVFNSNLTHMSRITSYHLDGRRDFAVEGLDPRTLALPPQVPDIEAIRSDYAFHLEGSADVDRWVRIFLDDLKARGLDDNTIVFVFSDHGGCLPRGKGFCYETSFRVPMVVYLPPKWQHLSKMPVGKPVERMVAFVDMAATVLSVAGIEPPKHMQGHPFLGKYDTVERKLQFGFVANQAKHYLPQRTVSDGHYKYVRRYIPYKSDVLLNSFQWQMPSNLYWDKTYFEGQCRSEACRLPYERSEAELFFDLEKDPFELHNLAGDSRYAAEQARLRAELDKHVRQSVDLGFYTVRGKSDKTPLYERVRTAPYDLGALYDLVELTATVTVQDIPVLRRTIRQGRSEMKFWAAVNLGVLARRGELKKAPEELVGLLQHVDGQIAQEAASAIAYTDRSADAFDFILAHPDNTNALEVLSLDREMTPKVPEKVRRMVREMSCENPGIDKDLRIDFRKVLVNWGELPAEQLYGPDVYEAGLKVNRTRRALIPIPAYTPKK